MPTIRAQAHSALNVPPRHYFILLSALGIGSSSPSLALASPSRSSRRPRTCSARCVKRLHEASNAAPSRLSPPPAFILAWPTASPSSPYPTLPTPNPPYPTLPYPTCRHTELFLTRPYDVGDLIDAGGGHHGWVITVGWRFTTLRLLSSAQHCAIPNVALADTRIQNFSRIEEGGRRGQLHVRVALSTPVRTLRGIPQHMKSAAVEAGFTVAWAFLTDTNEMGHGFTAVVKGPADGTEWDAKKQEALFGLYERLADDDVAFPAGCNASPIPLVKGTPRT